MVDNKSEINLAKNLITQERIKHIETKFHLVKITLIYCKKDDQLTCVLTKPFKI